MNIPESHKSNGFTSTLVEKSEPFALYRREKHGAKPHYEVVKFVPTKKDYTFPNGTKVPAGSVSYPTLNQWGKRGWTFTNIEQAILKLQDLATTNKRKATE